MNSFTLIDEYNSNVTKISSKLDFFLMLRNQTVYGWGRNQYGTLGLGDTTDRFSPTPISDNYNIIDISAGYVHSMILTSNGNVFTCGRNEVW